LRLGKKVSGPFSHHQIDVLSNLSIAPPPLLSILLFSFLFPLCCPFGLILSFFGLPFTILACYIQVCNPNLAPILAFIPPLTPCSPLENNEPFTPPPFALACYWPSGSPLQIFCVPLFCPSHSPRLGSSAPRSYPNFPVPRR